MLLEKKLGWLMAAWVVWVVVGLGLVGTGCVGE